MKGFFSVALALAIIALLLFVNVSSERNATILRETKSTLIEAESANMQRTVLENNTDRIIFEMLLAQALIKNFNSDLAKSAINKRLELYLKGKATLSSPIEEKEISEKNLNYNSSVMIVYLKGVTYAEYSFTGGNLRNMLVRKRFGENFGVEFLIPAGYTMRVAK